MDLARKIIDHNGINFHDLAREGELAGDIFLWFEPNGDRTEIRSLDAGSCQSVLENGNIRKLLGYNLSEVASDGTAQTVTKPNISKDRLEHLRFNSTTTSQYGRSSLRHVIYWLDVSDSLFEKNWLRGAQYYGNPLLAITGVPGPFQAAVKSQVEAQLQRAGTSWVLPPDTDVKVPDFSLGYPIEAIVGWVFRLISIATEIPVTLLGSADAASRGSAFYANPRFQLAIKPRREVWRLGLRQFFLKIFRQLGEIKQDEVITSKEFDFGFLPIFDNDFADIADIVEIYRDRKLISKQSSRELIGLDHTDEEERMDEEPEDELLTVPDPADPNAPPSSKPLSKPPAREARRKKRQERMDD